MMIIKVTMVLCASLMAVSAHAQENYPTRAIKLVVPFTPGSSSDVSARVIARTISGPLGQPVVVENRSGAGGGIAMQSVARSAPDGYTLVVGTVSSTVVPSIISKHVLFDLFKDFVPVATMANTTLLMTVAQESPFNSVAEVVAAARKNPKSLTYGNSAGLYRIAMEAFNDHAGIDILGVPYRGPADAAADMLGGRLSVNPDALGSVAPHLKSNRMRVLAVLSSGRTDALPSVPTMLELGYKDFEFNGWLGILAPAGTPQHIVERIEREVANAVNTEEIRALYKRIGLEPTVLSSKAYGEEMRKDLVRYQGVAERAGIERQ